MEYCNPRDLDGWCNIYAFRTGGAYRWPCGYRISVSYWSGQYGGKREPSELPYAGTRFDEPDLASFEARMLELRSLGYLFPDRVFDMINEQMEGE